MRRICICAVIAATALAGAAPGPLRAAPARAAGTPVVASLILADGAPAADTLVTEGSALVLQATVTGAAAPPTGEVSFVRFDAPDCTGPSSAAASATLAPQTLAVPHAVDLSNAAGWDSATSWNANGADSFGTNWTGVLFAGNDLANFASSSMGWRFTGLPLSAADTVTRAYLSLRIWQSRPSLASEVWGTWSTVLATDTRDGADFAGLAAAGFASRFNRWGAAWAIPFTISDRDPFRTGQGASYAASPDIADLVSARLSDPSWAPGGDLVAGVLNNGTWGIAEAAVDDVPDYARLHIEWTSPLTVQRAEAPIPPLSAGSYSLRAQYTGDAAYAPDAGPCMPLDVAPRDTDGDGYPDANETALGKNPAVYCPIMRADVDMDGSVTILDLSQLAGEFLQSVPPAPWRDDQGPAPRDGMITVLDLAIAAGSYLMPVSSCP